MQKIYFIVTFCFAFFVCQECICVAQPVIAQSNCFGGSGDDIGMNLIRTHDGGYLILGAAGSNDGDVSNNHGRSNAWILRMDSAMHLIWKKCYGGSLVEQANDAVETSNGDFVVVGFSQSSDFDVSVNHGTTDAWIFMIDANGTLLWEKSIGGDYVDFAYGVILNSQNQVIVTGCTKSSDGNFTYNYGGFDLFIAGMDLMGNILWLRHYGGTDDDMGEDILEVSPMHYLTIATSFSDDINVGPNHGASDVWIVQFDSVGHIEWKKNFGGSSYEFAMQFCKLLNGNICAVVVSYSPDGDVLGNHGNDDIWVFEMNPVTQAITRSRSIGGIDSDIPTGVCEFDNGGILITGRTLSDNFDFTSNHGDYDACLVSLDSNLNIRWTKTLGGSGEDSFSGILTDSFNFGTAAGYTESNDFDVNGNHSSFADFWLVKLDQLDGDAETQTPNFTFRVFPNPNHGSFRLLYAKEERVHSVEVFRLTGDLIYSQLDICANSQVDVSPVVLNPGIYVVCIKSESGFVSRQRMIVE